MTTPTKIEYPLNLLAENYVLYASSIGVQYVFEEQVNLDLFKEALQQFLEEFPALSGVANFKTWQVERSEKGVQQEICLLSKSPIFKKAVAL